MKITQLRIKVIAVLATILVPYVGAVEVPFDCRIESSNEACRRSVYCPKDNVILGLKAACNLESGEVSNHQLNQVSVNYLKVVRESDNRNDGWCSINSTLTSHGGKLIGTVTGLPWVTVACKEHDRNGGDCHIRGVLYCTSVR